MPKTKRKKNVRRYQDVYCTRLPEATADKLNKLLENKFPDMKMAELIRECIILGIARLEVEHVKQ